MFIKRLAVSSVDGMLRDIEFGPGLNLIVDDTPESAQSTATGNNVGKTTVLRLIDYCLHAYHARAKVAYWLGAYLLCGGHPHV